MQVIFYTGLKPTVSSILILEGSLLVVREKNDISLLWSRICDLSHFIQIYLFDFLLALQII